MANLLNKLKKGKDSKDPNLTEQTSSPSISSTASTEKGDHVESMKSKDGIEPVNGGGDKHRNRFSVAGHELVQKLHVRHGSPSPGSRKSTDIRKSTDLGRHSTDVPKNRGGDDMSKSQLRNQHKQEEVEEKADHRQRVAHDHQRQREEKDEKARLEEPLEMQQRYGTAPINNYAGEWKHEPRTQLLALKMEDIGKNVYFRARLHNVRKMSAKMVFFLLRQQTTTIQGVLVASDAVSEHMVRWAEHLPVETVLDIRGVIQQPKAKEGEVTGAFIHKMEVGIKELHVVAKLSEHLPFSVMEAEVTETEAGEEGSNRVHITDRTRLANRIIDLRSTASQAIFRVQAGVCGLFRSYLDSQGFMEIHSPKMQGGATESGASVFKVDYFGRPGFLAQSPQLAKQMSIAADFGKVYEIGAVFRAENSNTHRHLTEYTGLDIEMMIDEHYWEARNLIDRTLKSIFKGVYEKFRNEIEVIKRHFPHEDLVWLDETPIIPFREAVKMLNDSGWTDDDGNPIPEDEDFGTRDEIQFGRLMKDKYKTDYYIVDKFPSSARPFYTMLDPNDPTYTNSFDIFVRGQEITTGGQRIHDATLLSERMEKAKVDAKTMEEYMQGFEWAAPPHAGAGIGLERLLMLFLQLGDIRHASLYPRDPKSLPARKKVKQLRHPEASTLHPPWEGKDLTTAHRDLQPLESLIANYGDASNSSWLEPRMVIWRDGETGAAVGYVPHQGFAITIGDPLCHHSQYMKTIATYLDYLKRETDLKPLWLLCGIETADCLSDSKFDWRTFSCAAEQRLDLTRPLQAAGDPTVQRKIRHATKEGVKVHDILLDANPTPEFREKVDGRIKDWLGARKSHQHVHLTDVHPWQDMNHRQYHYATDKDGTICTLIVLAVLSPDHGWQVKFSLDFPNAPSGAIESSIIHALSQIKTGGASSCTFGGGASSNFTPGANLKGTKVKMLSRAYHTISTELKLTQKSEFREKLGAEEDPIYVCYPPKGLGPKGVHAILSFFED